MRRDDLCSWAVVVALIILPGCGLIYQKDAAAVVTAIGPQIQTTGSDVHTLYQGDVVVGRLAMGAGTLNPAAAIELRAE